MYLCKETELAGEDKPWKRCFDIQGIDWNQDGILNHMISEPNEICHTTRCIKAWNGMVAILEPQEDDNTIAPFLPAHVKKIVKKKAPTLTFCQVRGNMLEDTNLNFLEKAMLQNSLKKASTTREDSLKRGTHVIRDRLFRKTTSRQRWPKRLVPGSAVEARHNENRIKYVGKQPSSFTKQREIYNLFMSQLVPPMNNFRSRIEANLGIVVDWRSIDN